jgi:hypothetical protein
MFSVVIVNLPDSCPVCARKCANRNGVFTTLLLSISDNTAACLAKAGANVLNISGVQGLFVIGVSGIGDGTGIGLGGSIKSLNGSNPGGNLFIKIFILR